MKRTTEPLAEYTWLKIGGPAEIAVPESKEELVQLLRECHTENRAYRLLGNGSNLLVSDDRINELIIKNTVACTDRQFDGNVVSAGASVMVPQFINECIQHELGGYEYLYSVPGTIGGAIYMNAGRGAAHDKTISDYLVSVEVFSDGDTTEIPVDDLNFDHRYSSFQEHDDWVILSATFELPSQSQEEGREKAQQRMEKVNERDRSTPNAGSVFKSGARLPLHKIPPGGLSVGNARFIGPNRIGNDGDATFSDVKRLVSLAKLLNKLVPPFQTPEVEWKIWS
ncbi:UDP-N-acetylenolpyruvoylglucosamine reductase [Natrinema pellirubrum DSM 15624]|uniref:UDP-N-acetylenolpyruvoylglucosamine reductase n=1 Tax=Natrinema pellirubrum (strain DSM 15624 / CIP 106293 / JCM 10476 / NCIMB 786 / 157) TaxID=797303 RepID=L0JTF3_NATP1|nr:FAD-binding protein [Natrinema pellirubrum]AGB33676.1 UDP-N-acetylmuramate dehydrogenase [Natrinema pellirubrum DSM 15624]ELY68296.1 UDP-N-acetylenolpyruvoylglucosamine reductase [Natrinema pellirubrum DSM 15624]